MSASIPAVKSQISNAASNAEGKAPWGGVNGVRSILSDLTDLIGARGVYLCLDPAALPLLTIADASQVLVPSLGLFYFSVSGGDPSNGDVAAGATGWWIRVYDLSLIGNATIDSPQEGDTLVFSQGRWRNSKKIVTTGIKTSGPGITTANVTLYGGAGTGASVVSASGNSVSGRVRIQTGTSPDSDSSIFSVALPVPYANNNFTVFLQRTGIFSQQERIVVTADNGAGAFKVLAGNPLAAGEAYEWSYLIIQN